MRVHEEATGAGTPMLEHFVATKAQSKPSKQRTIFFTAKKHKHQVHFTLFLAQSRISAQCCVLWLAFATKCAVLFECNTTNSRNDVVREVFAVM